MRRYTALPAPRNQEVATSHIRPQPSVQLRIRTVLWFFDHCGHHATDRRGHTALKRRTREAWVERDVLDALGIAVGLRMCCVIGGSGSGVELLTSSELMRREILAFLTLHVVLHAFHLVRCTSGRVELHASGWRAQVEQGRYPDHAGGGVGVAVLR